VVDYRSGDCGVRVNQNCFTNMTLRLDPSGDHIYCEFDYGTYTEMNVAGWTYCMCN
jgi:hypothetical protein